MPEIMSEIEIITDGGRRRHWSAAEKLRIVEKTLKAGVETLHAGRHSERLDRPPQQLFY
jgi:transposase-like protein